MIFVKKGDSYMLDLLWKIVVMAVIGSIIGGFTNHIAIKMLFRPLEAKYLFGWRLPFTPGIIPKRRGAIAEQLGKTVVNYLLTPEMFRKKFFNAENKQKVEEKANELIQQYVFAEDKTLNDWLKQAGVADAPQLIEQKIDMVIDQQVIHFKNVLSKDAIEALLPPSWTEKVDAKIPEVSSYILMRGDDYFASSEGYLTIKGLIDNFLESKGALGGMVQMFLGDSDSIVLKVQKEIHNFLVAPGTFNMVNTILMTEWSKLRVQTIPQILGDLDFSSVTRNIQSYAKKELAIETHLDKPLVHYWPTGAQHLADNVVPQVVAVGFEKAEANLETAISRLDIQELVREQVDTFPLEVLEQLVLGITGRELRMITVLGFVLGGLIGIFQGIISYFM